MTSRAHEPCHVPEWIEILNTHAHYQTQLDTLTNINQPNSFIGPIPEFTRGSSAGAGSGKGHVKSASVSSPGPSADSSANSAATTDPLRQRYCLTTQNLHTLPFSPSLRTVSWPCRRESAHVTHHHTYASSPVFWFHSLSHCHSLTNLFLLYHSFSHHFGGALS